MATHKKDDDAELPRDDDPGTGWENFLRLKLIDKHGETKSANALCGHRPFVGIYFSDSESDVCKEFNQV